MKYFQFSGIESSADLISIALSESSLKPTSNLLMQSIFFSTIY